MKTKKYKTFTVLLVIAFILISTPIALTNTKEAEGEVKVTFIDFDKCLIEEIELTEEAVIEIGSGFEDYQPEGSDGEDFPGDRIRITGDGKIYFDDEGKFTHVENLVGSYEILDKDGGTLTNISSINDKEPITVYNSYDDFKQRVEENGGKFFWRIKEEDNVIHAGFDQKLIMGTGFFKLERQRSETLTSLDVESKSQDSLFYYINVGQKEIIEAYGKVYVKDDDDIFEGYNDVIAYIKESYESKEEVKILLDNNYLKYYNENEENYHDAEYLAYFGKRVYDINGDPVMIDREELVLGHNIGIKDGAKYFETIDDNYDALANYINDGNEPVMRKVTTIETFGGKQFGGGEFTLAEEGLDGAYIGSNGNEVPVNSAKGISFKVCANQGEPCTYLVCCHGLDCDDGSSDDIESYTSQQGLDLRLSDSKNIYKTCIGDAPDDIVQDIDEDYDEDYIVVDQSGQAFPDTEDFTDRHHGGQPFPDEHISHDDEHISHDDEHISHDGEHIGTGEGHRTFDQCGDGYEWDHIKGECVRYNEKRMPYLDFLLNNNRGGLEIEKGDTVAMKGVVINGDSNARISIKVDGREIRVGANEIVVSHTFREEGAFSVSFEYPESENYLTSTITRTVVVQSTEERKDTDDKDTDDKDTDDKDTDDKDTDDKGPKWIDHGTIPESDSPYSKNKEHVFWIQWDDPGTLDRVEIEHDFSGTMQKTTVARGSDNKYTFRVTGLEMGNYRYRWHARDKNGLTASTRNMIYAVSKGEPIVTIRVNNKQFVEDEIRLYKGTYTFNIILNEPSDAEMSIVFDRVLREKDFTLNMYRFGRYQLSISVSETELFKGKTFTKYVYIERKDPDILVKINGISNQDVIETESSNVGIEIELLKPEEGSVSYYLNNELIKVIDSSIGYSYKSTKTLEPGEHIVKAIFSETEEYKEFAVERKIIVLEP